MKDKRDSYRNHNYELASHLPTLRSYLDAISKDGYAIVRDAIPETVLDELTESLERLEREHDIEPATNSFEGRHTVRIYNLLAFDTVFQQIPTCEMVLPICEGVLDKGLLISSLSSIGIDSGEVAQPIHADDQIIPLSKPHEAIICNTMWALTDFTEENGATRLIPGSHRSDHSPEYGALFDSIPAEMERGSVLIWHGSLWHGGGANRTPHRRIGIAMNYCAGYIRQQENQQLGLSRTKIEEFSPRLRELIGLDVYRGLIGHIDKQTPASWLFSGSNGDGMLWDHAQ